MDVMLFPPCRTQGATPGLTVKEGARRAAGIWTGKEMGKGWDGGVGKGLLAMRGLTHARTVTGNGKSVQRNLSPSVTLLCLITVIFDVCHITWSFSSPVYPQRNPTKDTHFVFDI